MIYAVHITVNSDRGEWDYTVPKEKSIDALIERTTQMHPEYTSMCISIVPMRSLQVETEA